MGIKLRNKETGQVEKAYIAMDGDKIAVIVADMPLCGNSVLGEYDSLAEFNEEWEDYKPKEPLITTDGVRDAVYSWASSLEIRKVRCKKRMKGVEVTTFEAFKLGSAPRIEFASWSIDADVTDGAIYTIDELCGAPEPLEPTFIDLDERIKEKEEE